MDPDGTTARPSTYVGGGEATVSSFITLIIVLAGVLGGLIIVVIVILICKYCVKGNKPSRRSLRDGSSGMGEGGREVRLLQRYETINSDMLSEPSSASLDGIPLSPRKPHEHRGRGRREETEEVNERTQLRSSFDKELQAEEGATTVLDDLECEAGGRKGDTGSRRAAPRHGSRDLEGSVGEEVEAEGRSSSPGSLLEERGAVGGVDSRHTEGDFHHPKYARMSTLPGHVIVEEEIPISTHPSRPTPSLGSTALHAAFRYSLDERLRILQQDAERSFPPLHPSSQKRSPRAKRRGSSPEGRLRSEMILSEEVEGATTLGRIRVPPSPPAILHHGSPHDHGGRWRRRSRGGTPSASPSPPGEPVYRQVNVEVHRGQDREEPMLVVSTSQEQVAEQQRVPSTTTTSPTTTITIPTTTTTTTTQDTGPPQQQHSPPPSPPHPSGSPPLPSPTGQEITRYTHPHHHHQQHQQQQHNQQQQQQQQQQHPSSTSKFQEAGLGPNEATSDPSATPTPTPNPPATLHLTPQQPEDAEQSVVRHVQRAHAQAYGKRISHSLELAGARRRLYPGTRKVKSYEDVADHDVLQITEFSRGPFYNTDYDVISEMASPTSSKVRYNDTGSLEELAEEAGAEEGATCLALEALLPDISPGEGEGGDFLCTRNRDLWMLRATLEEEEECSDTIRMEDGTSPEESPQQEQAPPPVLALAVSDVNQQRNGNGNSNDHWEKAAETAVEEGGSPPDAADVSTEDGGPHSLPSPPPPPSSSGCGGDDGGGCCSNGVEVPVGAAAQLLHPNYETRRQTYKNGRHGRSSGGSEDTTGHGRGQASANNSFDSVETDGEVSDTSRQEVTSTSFESTTDNTDSTTESQHSRLRQMKTDSGYKSLETQQSGVRDPGDMLDAVDLPGEYIVEWQEPLDDAPGDLEEGRAVGHGHSLRSGAYGGAGAINIEREHHGEAVVGRYDVAGGRRNSNAVHFERRAGRTASKKRREYSRDRQIIPVYESVREPEETAASGRCSTESVEGSSSSLHPPGGYHPQQHSVQPPASKRSVFTRFFSQARDPRDKYMVRDYSIDEKTNQIFNEFLRQESSGDSCPGRGEGGARLGLRRSPRPQHRSRMQRKHTDPLYRLDDRRRDRLAPEMRSSSMGSDSSAGSVRRLSPQDSIEEEFEEEGEEEGDWTRPELTPAQEVGGEGGGEGLEGSKSAAMYTTSKGIPDITAVQDIAAVPEVVAIPVTATGTDRAAIPDIPIIKLPEEEA